MKYDRKRRAARPHSALLKGIVLLLCLAMFFSSVPFGGMTLLAKAADTTVTVTVNYVYQSNSAMVAQPYTAQLEKGAAFKKTLEVPKLFNYSIPTDKAVGLSNGIELKKDDTTGDYTLNFDLSSVNDDVTVTLYYVAGTAKYTVYHYYQNLEDNSYAQDPKIVELEGDIDAYTQAVANNKDGFRCKGIPQTTIAADGTTKVEIYYDREYYTVTFDVNGGIDGPEPIYAKYGTTFDASKVKEPKRKGYRFLGWSPELTGTVTIEQSMTYVAQWEAEKGHADYTIVLWGQNANDDEYSYLSSHQAWGNVGDEVTWKPQTLISHVHTDKCWERTCGKEEHTHTAECLKNCPHTHDLTCYGLNANASSVNPNDEAQSWNDSKPETYFEQLGLEDGYLYYDDENARLSWFDVDLYYLRFNGKYYSLTEKQFNQLKGDQVDQTSDRTSPNPDYYYKYSINQSGMSCTHKHDASCYSCGKEEHKHSDKCGTLTCGLSETPKKYMSDIQPDSELWNYERSDTVTVAADGKTVLNVYFTRKVFTLQFRDAYSNNNDFGAISARWGKNIADEYNAIVKKAGSSFWSENRDASGPYTNYIGVMPQRNITYYRYMPDGYGTSTMTYYAEDLNGTYQVIFTLTFKGTGYQVTDEDRYEFEGFTYDHGTANGDDCDGAAFYYKRNTYSLEFYSASQNATDQQHTVKYQAPLSPYAYTPTAKPGTLETNAFFVGWYQNPECTGEPYDLATHTMPNANKALYAKWVNGLYTVRTYTDETMQTPYTYEGYTGVQKNIEKYTLATAPKDPSKPPYVFVGWFYRDEETETEKPFSFTMPITRDYKLYPKYSTLVSVTYLVHYYKKGTTERIADDRTNSVMIGQTVTEKAKMGTDLNLLPAEEQGKYYPEKTSTSEIIRQDNQEIIFYYTEATSGKYTVYYQDAIGNDLHEPVTKTTAFSTVTEQYLPIPGYAPKQYSIQLDLSSDPEQNKITFIYEPTRTTLTIQKSGWEAIDENQTFLFHIQGIEDTTKEIDLTVTVHGNGKTTITDLPVGKYRVTEMTGWSWRYTPAGNAQEITLDVGGTTLTFANQRAKNNWLDGDSFHVNLFGANP